MNDSSSLASIREENNHRFIPWLRKHAPWLFSIHSLFYFFLFVFVLGLLWMGYSLISNYGTQMYGWDYEIQYVEFQYEYWDIWRYFFKTGHFTLYDTSVFFGSDTIGSGSYYGLFDPFMFLTVLFPRSWIPQEFAILTAVKGAVGALCMRSYLLYKGVSEKSSRVGAVAFAFCGYINFMVGFPTFVSVCSFAPLVMLGVEKVIKEKKISTLIFGLALIGLVSFFFLVVFCIWGVIYALWRYFWTIKTRNKSDNLKVIGLGVMSFALGIGLIAWTLFPSLRESSLSGRTSSIGKAYLTSLLNAFKGQDFKTIFARLFELVGDNPGRELMGLVSFFFPTVNYLYLPVYSGGGYDAWTASLFCYTPMVIFFIFELFNSVRTKDWEHLVALPLCLYLVFTTFAYYFFYAFSGDGYGRWFIVLVPLIILQATKGIDHIKGAPTWQLPNACLVTVFMTVVTYFITYFTLEGKSFSVVYGQQYWTSSYNVPAKLTNAGNYAYFFGDLRWIIIYQIILTVVEGGATVFFSNRQYLDKILIGFISLETIVCGNCSFLYGSSYNYGKYFNGGYDSSISWTVANQLQDAVDQTSELDDGYYRSYVDYPYAVNLPNGMGYNGTSTFHSLFNYATADLARDSHVLANEVSNKSYADVTVIQKSWAGAYSNKRFDFDTALGMKYYYIINEDTSDFSGVWENDDYLYNVPFGSKLVYKNSKYAVYENPYYINLGHKVDSYYRFNKLSDSSKLNYSDFYSNLGGTSGYHEMLRNEQVYLNGAIFDDDDSLSDEFPISEAPSLYSMGNYTDISSSVRGYIYSYSTKDRYNVSDPGGFLNDTASDTLTIKGPFIPSGVNTYPGIYVSDDPNDASTDGKYGKMVWRSNSSSGYFNDENEGAYFLFGDPSSSSTRIYMIGDYTDSQGVSHTNVQLNYEYHAIAHMQSSSDNSAGIYRNGLFGIYAPGKVKAIVFQRKDETTGTDFVPFLLRLNKSDFLTQYEYLKEGSLQNVTYSPDNFTFTSNYTKKEIVVTSLGYDAGWQAYATVKKDSGASVTEKCVMHRLDGGFVGFEAPAGEVSYTLKYTTPYLHAGVKVAIASLTIYFGYEIAIFVLGYKRMKKHMGLDEDVKVKKA